MKSGSAKKEYSMWTDWKVNGWLFVATHHLVPSDIMFPHLVQQWPSHYGR